MRSPPWRHVAPELGLGALAHRLAALAKRLAGRQQVAVDAAVIEALDRDRPVRLLQQPHAVLELQADAVAARAGNELAVDRGRDLDAAAGAAPLDEHAAQMAAVGSDLAGAEGRALAGIDEPVLLHLRVPAGLQRVVDREPVAVARERLQVAEEVDAERDQQQPRARSTAPRCGRSSGPVLSMMSSSLSSLRRAAAMKIAAVKAVGSARPR